MWGIQLTVTDPRLKNSICLRLSHKNMNSETQWKSSEIKKIQKQCGYWHLDYFGICDSMTFDSLDSIYLIEYSKSCLGTQ